MRKNVRRRTSKREKSPVKAARIRRKRARGENVIDYAYVGNDAFLCARPQAADEAGKDGNDAGLIG